MSKDEKRTMVLIFSLFAIGIGMLIMQDYILGR